MTSSALLWLELLEKHGRAAALAAQLTAPGGSAFGAAQRYRESAVEIQKEIGALGELLATAEEIIRQRLMDDDGGPDADAGAAAPVAAPAPSPPTATANGRVKQKQKAATNSLDAYLTRSPPVNDDDDVVFVNSVRGWDAPSHVLGRAVSGGEEVLVLDGIELHDLMMQNNARNVGMQTPHAAAFRRYNAPAAPTTPRPRATKHPTQQPPPSQVSVEKSAKKRKLSSASPSRHHHQDPEATAAAQLQSQEQPPRRVVNKTIQSLQAEKVLTYREGNHLCEYLVKWVGLDDPLWVFRKQCAEQGKQVIDSFNRKRKSGSSKAPAKQQSASHHDAPSDDDYSPDGGDIFIVDKIVDHRVRYGKKQYLVKWDGYDSSENTWEAAGKLQADVADVVEAYERKVARKEQQAVPRAVSSSEQVENPDSSGGQFEPTSTRRHESEEEREPKLITQKIGDSDAEAASDRRSDGGDVEMESGGSRKTGGVIVVGGSDSEDHDLV